MLIISIEIALQQPVHPLRGFLPAKKPQWHSVRVNTHHLTSRRIIVDIHNLYVQVYVRGVLPVRRDHFERVEAFFFKIQFFDKKKISGFTETKVA